MRAPDIECPYCGSPMIPGIARVRGTLLGFLLIGLSYQHLWFESGRDKVTVVPSGDERAAHRCPRCGAVSVFPMAREWDL